MSEETKKPEKKDTVEALEARLQELQAELDRVKLKNLGPNSAHTIRNLITTIKNTQRME